MKKTILFPFIAAFLFLCCPLSAQVIGIESPIKEKNIFIGFKAGVTAMDMAYTITSSSSLGQQFVNHSAIYTGFDQILNCLAGGITVERTLPQFSYGLELMVTGLKAKNTTKEYHFAELDTAYYVHARIPVRWNLLKGKKVTPYLVVAPDVSTYISADSLPLLNRPINGYSVWNAHGVEWGTKYANTINVNVLAGAGMNIKIDVSDYQFYARFEAAYNLGLLNTIPSGLKFGPDTEISRKMRGWEATIGLSFPLFKNPSYQWLM